MFLVLFYPKMTMLQIITIPQLKKTIIFTQIYLNHLHIRGKLFFDAVKNISKNFKEQKWHRTRDLSGKLGLRNGVRRPILEFH